MRKIVFNATILNDRPTGLGCYCKNIIDNIDSKLFDYILYTDNLSELPKNEFGKNKIILKNKHSNKLLSIISRNFGYKKWLSKHACENILHYSPTQHGVNNKKIKQIITVHDLMPLYYKEGRLQQYIYYKYLLKRVLRNSEVVITVSENTKKDIIKEYGIAPDKVRVIYNGFDKPSEPVDKEKSKKYILDKFGLDKYLLMVGIHYSYKNLHSVIEAFYNIKDKTDAKLVLVGNADVAYGKELKKLVKEKGIEDRVEFLGYVEDCDKHKLYQAAELFIYPSLYEGFGLPVLEAMANNTLVACSNTSSLPEVVGEAAYKFNPSSVKEIECAILKMTNLSQDEKNKYLELSRKQLDKFSWEKCAGQVQDVIVKVSKMR